MLIKILFTILTIAFADENPVTYDAEKFSISSMEQYMERVDTYYSNVENKVIMGGTTDYKGSTYTAFTLDSYADRGSQTFSQTLKYAEIYPGVWALSDIYVKICRTGEVMREGEWVTIEICDEDPDGFPVFAGITDVFIVEDTNLSLETLSEVIGKELSYSDTQN